MKELAEKKRGTMRSDMKEHSVYAAHAIVGVDQQISAASSVASRMQLLHPAH